MKQGPDVCAGFVSETPPTQSGERPGGRAGCAEERRAEWPGQKARETRSSLEEQSREGRFSS